MPNLSAGAVRAAKSIFSAISETSTQAPLERVTVTERDYARIIDVQTGLPDLIEALENHQKIEINRVGQYVYRNSRGEWVNVDDLVTKAKRRP